MKIYRQAVILLFAIFTSSILFGQKADNLVSQSNYLRTFDFNGPLIHNLIHKSFSKSDSICKIYTNQDLNFDSCTFNYVTTYQRIDSCKGDFAPILFLERLEFYRSNLEKVTDISSIGFVYKESNLCFEKSHFELINLSKINSYRLTIRDSWCNHYFSVGRSNIDRLLFLGNQSKLPVSELSIGETTINESLDINDNDFDHIYLSGCTIKKEIFIQRVGMNKPQKHILVRLTNTFIDGQCTITLSDKNTTSKIIFINCSFGPMASLFGLKTDSIEFINCNNIPHPLFISPGINDLRSFSPLVSSTPFSKTIKMRFENSNFENIKFDYGNSFELYFIKKDEELIASTYQNLLAKFKKEGKDQSFENLDIEFKRREYSNNCLLYPVWFLDYAWWRYSYSKWLVIVWTLVFLFIFFLYNYKNWDGMRRIYGVFDKEQLEILSQLDTKGRNRRKATFVLLFTSFIFFSLRIDFDKLKYASTKFLAAFFVQYIIGLICLFFLANAIFKLG